MCLFNGRPYVQGTQMIAQACEQLAPPQARLVEAKFLRLTDRRLRARRLPEAAPETADVVAVLKLQAPQSDCVLMLHEGNEPAPSRSAEVTLRLHPLEHDGRLNGHWRFEQALGLAGLLDAVVQGVKRLHEMQPEPVCDVWFTGLRQIHLPLQGLPPGGRGRLDVSRLRVLSAGVRHQSLLRLTLELEGLAQPLTGQVSFAYRNPVQSDVH